MMMAHRHNIAARLIDAAVNDPLGVRPRDGRLHRLGIERVFEDVVGLDQSRRPRARQQVTARIVRMAHADMTESVEYAFMAKDAVGNREFDKQLG